MIAIFRRTPAGVERVATASTRAEALAALSGILALMAAVGPLHCTERRCAKCRAAIRTGAAVLTARAT